MEDQASDSKSLRRFALPAVVVVQLLLVVIVLRARGLRMDLHAFRFTLEPMLGSVPRVLVAGLLLNIFVAIFRRKSVPAYLRGFVGLRSLASWAGVCIAFMAVTFAYTWLKVCVPLLNPRLWDHELQALDRGLHVGFSPSVFFVELFSGTPLLPALDLWYSFWISTVFLAWVYASAQPDLTLRRKFALGCALLWSAGAWIYLAVPALGPCFVDPSLFANQAEEIRRAVATQGALARNYALMIAGRDGSLSQFNPYFGVAALPSLHVGAHWFFALWARRHARRLFLPLAVATALTFTGSIATGWHYAVDGYAGMLLAWLVMLVVDRLEPETAPLPAPEPLSAPAPEP